MMNSNNGTSTVPFSKYRTLDMPGIRETAIVGLAGLLGLLACYLYFSTNSNLDMKTTRGFFDAANGRFEWAHDTRVHFVRRSILNCITAFYVAVTFMGLHAYRHKKPVLRLEWNKWLFLGTAGLVGPVMLVNVLLKGNWGRSRPKDVLEFGGNLEFTPFWQWADQCRDNCSFTSGEVASVAMIFLSVGMLVSARWRLILLVPGIVLFVGTGWLRVATGSHFLSDAIVSLPLMMMVVAGTYYWFYLTHHNPLLRYLENLPQKASKAKE